MPIITGHQYTYHSRDGHLTKLFQKLANVLTFIKQMCYRIFNILNTDIYTKFTKNFPVWFYDYNLYQACTKFRVYLL